MLAIIVLMEPRTLQIIATEASRLLWVEKLSVLSPTERKSMLYVQIYLRKKFNVPHHRGMQPYLITYSHRYISSSLHGKLSKTSEATVKCIYYCLFKLQKDDSKDLH